MKHKEFTFHLFKTDFFGQYWQPEISKGVVVLLHGMGGHSSRYDVIVDELVENNFTVISYDNFGHGKTSGKRGHNPSFEALLTVIEEVIKEAEQLEANKPVFLYGHSMGGNLVVNYVLRKNHNLAGVVATSPFLELAFEPPVWKMKLGKFLQKVAPSITLGNELDLNHISREKNAIKIYENDSLVHNRISPNYSLTIIETGTWAIENAIKLSTPMFVLHGTNDKIIDYRGSVKFTKNTDLAALKLFEGGYHELHNDSCKKEFMLEITNWLNSQI